MKILYGPAAHEEERLEAGGWPNVTYIRGDEARRGEAIAQN
jgi:hypothetical protein